MATGAARPEAHGRADGDATAGGCAGSATSALPPGRTPRRPPPGTHLLAPLRSLGGSLRPPGARGARRCRRPVPARRGSGLRAAVAAELGAQLQVTAQRQDVQRQRQREEAEEQPPAAAAAAGARTAGRRRLPPALRTHGRRDGAASAGAATAPCSAGSAGPPRGCAAGAAPAPRQGAGLRGGGTGGRG